jgi:hypothetical protein
VYQLDEIMKNILVTFAVACFASSAFAGAPRVTTPADVYQQDWMRKAIQNAKAEMNNQDGQNLAFLPPNRDERFLPPNRDERFLPPNRDAKFLPPNRDGSLAMLPTTSR